MYTLMLATALTTSADSPEFLFHHKKQNHCHQQHHSHHRKLFFRPKRDHGHHHHHHGQGDCHGGHHHHTKKRHFFGLFKRMFAKKHRRGHHHHHHQGHGCNGSYHYGHGDHHHHHQAFNYVFDDSVQIVSIDDVSEPQVAENNSPEPQTALPVSSRKEVPANAARITVNLNPKARLFVDGVLCPLTSSQRSFTTPELQPGQKYFYTLRVELNTDGQPRTETRQVVVTPGQDLEVDFHRFATRLAAF